MILYLLILTFAPIKLATRNSILSRFNFKWIMANFIEKTLEAGEQVIFKGRLHWSYHFRYTVWGLLFILPSVAGMIIMALSYDSATGTETTSGDTSWLWWLCGIGCLVGVGLIAYGYFIRSRTEFAITNHRFVQKDGIFSIKMTEIPLFKIETVNFYQTFMERILNTGAIELVGSGGTTHKVEFVQNPYQVRNFIATQMKQQDQRTEESTAGCDA